MECEVDPTLFTAVCKHVLQHVNVLRSYELEAFAPLLAQTPLPQREGTGLRLSSNLKKKCWRWRDDPRRVLRAGFWPAVMEDRLPSP